MDKAWIAAIVLASASFFSWASQESLALQSDQDMKQRPLPPAVLELGDQSFEQSAAGTRFGVIALATLDHGKPEDLKPGVLPKIRQARLVAVGEKVKIMVFLATRPGFELVAARAPLEYAIDIYKPDGTLQERMDNNVCLSKDDKLQAGSLAVCEQALIFELEPTDAMGQWVFKVSMMEPGAEKPLVFGTSVEAYGSVSMK